MALPSEIENVDCPKNTKELAEHAKEHASDEAKTKDAENVPEILSPLLEPKYKSAPKSPISKRDSLEIADANKDLKKPGVKGSSGTGSNIKSISCKSFEPVEETSGEKLVTPGGENIVESPSVSSPNNTNDKTAVDGENLADQDDIDPVILGVCKVTELPSLHSPVVNLVLTKFLGNMFNIYKFQIFKEKSIWFNFFITF